jgi:predicted nucleic acid-binding protein
VARYLIDSNVIIDFVKLVPSAVEVLRGLPAGDELCVCDVVLNEVLAGTFPHAEVRTRILLEPASFLPTSREAAERAGRMRFALSRQGIQISLPDSLIAMTAEEHGATVVTRNVRDFTPTGVRLLPLPPLPRS